MKIKTLFFSIALVVPAYSQDPAESRRVAGQDDALGAQVVVNQIDASAYPRVSIFATVLKDGSPLRGLDETDFKVFEDDVKQLPLTVVPKLSPLSVVLAIDVSGSMKRKMNDVQVAAAAFVKSLSPEDRIHIVTFEREVRRLTPPQGVGQEDAMRVIAMTKALGDTRLYDGIHESVSVLKDIPGRRAVVLLSDGADDNGRGGPLSVKSLDQAIAHAKEVNIPVYTIGIGSGIDEGVLRKTAGSTGGLSVAAPSLTELYKLYAKISEHLGGQYFIYYSSQKPGDGASREISLAYGASTGSKLFKAPIIETAEPVAVIESTFEKSTDNWGIVGDGKRGKDPDLEGSEIRANDDAAGGIWYWSAPEAYLGDKSQFVGGRLSYRMRVTEITSPFDGCDEFQIHGADIVLGYNTTEVPEVEMKEFHIPLTPSPAWTNVTEDRPATAGDFEKVMSSMTALLIRGEYHSGPDSGWLDQVSLEERR